MIRKGGRDGIVWLRLKLLVSGYRDGLYPSEMSPALFVGLAIHNLQVNCRHVRTMPRNTPGSPTPEAFCSLLPSSHDTVRSRIGGHALM